MFTKYKGIYDFLLYGVGLVNCWCKPSRGDVARVIGGAVSTFIVLALLYEPTVKLFALKILLSSAAAVACVVTARSKAGVLFGIGLVILVRLIIGTILFRFN